MKMRLLAILLCAAMLLGLAPAGAESVTQVSLTIWGLTGLGDGTFERRELVMTFELSQGGETVGSLTTSDGSAVTLPSAESLTLIPASDTTGWQISPYGYVMPVTAGVLNQAAIEVYADAGLFAVTAEPGAGVGGVPIMAPLSQKPSRQEGSTYQRSSPSPRTTVRLSLHSWYAPLGAYTRIPTVTAASRSGTVTVISPGVQAVRW